MSSTKQSIREIFKLRGELYFRKKESLYLKKLINKENFVLSTGGGTPIFYNHMEMINATSASYYLYAPPSVLSERLLHEKEQRPMIAHLSEETLPEFIAKHLFERNPFYQQAQHRISTTGKSVEDIVAALGVSKYDVDGVKQDMKTAKTELKEAMRKRFARLIK